MNKNPQICQTCSFKDKRLLEKIVFEKYEKEIGKIRELPDGEKKDDNFFLIIRICLNEIEMFSCLNCMGATGENEPPNETKLSKYFCLHRNGARLLGELKFPEILNQVTDSFNESETWHELNRKPDAWDDFKHYVFNNGLEDYYQKHPQHVPKDEAAEAA